MIQEWITYYLDKVLWFLYIVFFWFSVFPQCLVSFYIVSATVKINYPNANYAFMSFQHFNPPVL